MVTASAPKEVVVVRHRPTGGSCAGWAGWAWPWSTLPSALSRSSRRIEEEDRG